FFFQAEDGIRDFHVTGVQTCALPIYRQPLPTCRSCSYLCIAGACSGLPRGSVWGRTFDCAPGQAVRLGNGQAIKAMTTAPAPSKIGRASCRERVSIWVGGESVERREE